VLDAHRKMYVKSQKLVDEAIFSRLTYDK